MFSKMVFLRTQLLFQFVLNWGFLILVFGGASNLRKNGVPALTSSVDLLTPPWGDNPPFQELPHLCVVKSKFQLSRSIGEKGHLFYFKSAEIGLAPSQ